MATVTGNISEENAAMLSSMDGSETVSRNTNGESASNGITNKFKGLMIAAVAVAALSGGMQEAKADISQDPSIQNGALSSLSTKARSALDHIEDAVIANGEKIALIPIEGRSPEQLKAMDDSVSERIVSLSKEISRNDYQKLGQMTFKNHILEKSGYKMAIGDADFIDEMSSDPSEDFSWKNVGNFFGKGLGAVAGAAVTTTGALVDGAKYVVDESVDLGKKAYKSDAMSSTREGYQAGTDTVNSTISSAFSSPR